MLISKRLGRLTIGKISSFTAMPDIVAILATQVTLNVEVIGDLRGHTFLWEQIAGTTVGVSFTTPTNQFTVTYTNNPVIGTFDDKRFRFWIDKGTPRAQYKDIWVYGSPVDVIQYSTYNNSAQNNITTQIGTTYINAYMERININYPDGSSFAGNCIEWDVPVNHDATRFKFFQIEQFNRTSGSWDPVGIVTEFYNRIYLNPVINTLYRVLGVYNISNLSSGTGQYLYVSSNQIWYESSNSIPQNSWMYETVSNATYNNSSDFNIVSGLVSNTLIKQTIEESVSWSKYNNDSSQNTVSGLTVNTLIKYDLASDVFSGSNYNNADINNVISNFIVNNNNVLGG